MMSEDDAEAARAHAREIARDKVVLAIFVVVAAITIALWRVAGG